MGVVFRWQITARGALRRAFGGEGGDRGGSGMRRWPGSNSHRRGTEPRLPAGGGQSAGGRGCCQLLRACLGLGRRPLRSPNQLYCPRGQAHRETIPLQG